MADYVSTGWRQLVAFRLMIAMILLTAIDGANMTRADDPVPSQPSQKKPVPTEKEDAERKSRDVADDAVAAQEAGTSDDKERGNGRPLRVREKVAAGAAVAAEAVEEVGQVFGNLLGELLIGNRAGPVVVQGEPRDLMVKQFEAQYGRHFDAILRTELHFIRVVCKTSRKQYEAISDDAKLVRTKAIRKFAQFQNGMNQGVMKGEDSDCRQQMVSDLLISVARHLSTEQLAAYRSELAARAEARRRVAVYVTTARIDRKLMLSSDQREQVRKMLDQDWDVSWNAAEMLMYGGHYFPDVPDAKLTPLLSAAQEKVWRTVSQQGEENWGFNPGMNQPVALPDEQWEDNDPPGAADPGQGDKGTRAAGATAFEANPTEPADSGEAAVSNGAVRVQEETE